MNRYFKTGICLLMAFCLILFISPIRAHATAATVAIAGVSTVSVPAALVIGAAAIALGIMVGVSSNDFQHMVSNATSTLSNWVKDGTVELMRVVDEAGTSVYYAASDFMEALRNHFSDAGVLSSLMSTSKNIPNLDYGYFWSDIPFGYVTFTCSEANTYFRMYYSRVLNGQFYSGYDYGQKYSTYTTKADNRGNSYNGYYLVCSYGNLENGSIPSHLASLPCLGDFTKEQLKMYETSYDGSWGGAPRYVTTHCPLLFTSSLDLTLGNLPSVPVDGTSARQWSEEYTDKGLHVIGGSNDPDPPDQNNGRWFWPLALGLTAAELYAFSQADEWSGKTPQEFDDYSTKTEYEIVSRPEVEFGQSIEISPITKPDVDPDPGNNPGSGTDSPSGSTPIDEPSHYTIDLKEFFPFCIPWDLYEFMNILAAEPRAPEFDWVIYYDGEEYKVHIDLSAWDSVAALFRTLELLGFIVGLAYVTRAKYIRG